MQRVMNREKTLNIKYFGPNEKEDYDRNFLKTLDLKLKVDKPQRDIKKFKGKNSYAGQESINYY